MQAKQILAPVLIGLALIVLGLTPGLLARLMQGIHQFRDSFLGIRQEAAYHPQGEYLPGQFWVAVLGGALVLLALAAYLTVS